jgi:ribose-phosphate pyrophosphokinase
MIEFWNDKESWVPDGPLLYSDGTPMLKTGWFDEIVAEATGVTIQPRNLDEFFAGIAAVQAVNSKRDHRVPGNGIDTLILPYIPGARQDRVNPTGDILHTLRTVGGMINQCNFKQVICADPHSKAVYGYINNLVEYPLVDIYAHLWKGYDAVIAPDKGGRGRASIAAGVLDKPVVFANKVRDVTNGHLTGFAVDVEAGKHYLVVDDICDGGGTFLGLGEKITEQDAFADLYVTHGIFSKGIYDLNKMYRNVYTTDTFITPVSKYMYKFPIVKDMRSLDA